MDPGPVEPGWTAVGMFRPFLHRADLSRPPWIHRGRRIWFAACNHMAVPLAGPVTVGRWYCPDCRRLADTNPPR